MGNRDFNWALSPGWGPRCGIAGRRFLLVLFSPLLLGWSWKDASGITINPLFVERVQDGKTTKQEVLLYFGDPKEIERTSDGLVYKYFSYKDAQAMPYRPELRRAPGAVHL